MLPRLFFSYLVMISLPDFTDPFWFFITMIAFFLVLTLRYFVIGAIFYWVFYIGYKNRWQSHKLSAKSYPRDQFRREIRWSLLTGIIFSVSGAVTLVLWQLGYTKIYTDLLQYGWWWLPVSLAISLLIHEFYYYWIHRWMHRPQIFKLVHKVHHESAIPSPWTAFAFHPLEGLLQAIIIPVVLLVIPLHPYVILVQLVIMSLSSVINHLDIEIFPASMYRNPIGRLLIGATHHSQHHKHTRYNFGLYFTFLDKIHGTESPAYTDMIKPKPGQIAETVKP